MLRISPLRKRVMSSTCFSDRRVISASAMTGSYAARATEASRSRCSMSRNDRIWASFSSMSRLMASHLACSSPVSSRASRSATSSSSLASCHARCRASRSWFR